jgi:hypothetical protein
MIARKEVWTVEVGGYDRPEPKRPLSRLPSCRRAALAIARRGDDAFL